MLLLIHMSFHSDEWISYCYMVIIYDDDIVTSRKKTPTNIPQYLTKSQIANHVCQNWFVVYGSLQHQRYDRPTLVCNDNFLIMQIFCNRRCEKEPDMIMRVTLRPRQNGHHFPDDIFKHSFLNENVSITISLTFVPWGRINYIGSDNGLAPTR